MLDRFEKTLEVILPLCFILQGLIQLDNTLIGVGLILQHLFMTQRKKQ